MITAKHQNHSEHNIIKLLSPKRCQDPVLWAWLGIFSLLQQVSVNSYITHYLRLSYFFHSVPYTRAHHSKV